MSLMDISLFDYELPGTLIAQEPAPLRDHSRLMILRKEDGELIHESFYDIYKYLRPGDLLVFNKTRVFPARLMGKKDITGGAAECFLLHRTDEENIWSCLVKPGKRLPPGTKIIFGDGALTGVIEDRTDGGGRLVRFSYSEDSSFFDILEKVGTTPLPPYIKAPVADPERYQTVYGDTPGSSAASTAGLHFTGELLRKIAEMGVESATVLLHIGPGTFRPVKVKNIEEHKMHSEYCEISAAAAAQINKAKAEGRRVIAVGTTALRTLEAMATGVNNSLEAGSTWTDIFIYPGYKFKIINGLLTNFHLPKSSLIMLVSALAGRDRILEAYKEAVRREYRFFSFGDAMLII